MIGDVAIMTGPITNSLRNPDGSSATSAARSPRSPAARTTARGGSSASRSPPRRAGLGQLPSRAGRRHGARAHEARPLPRRRRSHPARPCRRRHPHRHLRRPRRRHIPPAILPRLDRTATCDPRRLGRRHRIEDVVLEAPIDAPQKYLGIGMNYREHAEEAAAAGIPIPDQPALVQQAGVVHRRPVRRHREARVSDQLDYEVELGVVIGRRCQARRASKTPARSSPAIS